MDTQIIVIALNLAVIPSCSFFVGLWIKRIEATLLKLQDSKAGVDVVATHITQSELYRAELMSQVKTVADDAEKADDDLVEQFRGHGHEIICGLCKAKAGGVILK